MQFKLSIVIPSFNEEGNIKDLYTKLISCLREYHDYEIIFVDDGSMDDTLANIKELVDWDDRVTYLSLSRNFGHQKALKAGLDRSTGDCVISMDADLQHPPELISEMVNKWQQGYDIVYTVRKDDPRLSIFKRKSAALFYKFLNKIADVNIEKGAADFRLLDQRVVNELRQFNEAFLFLRGIISWIGFKQTAIHYMPNERNRGQSKYSIKKMFLFAFCGITSFSVKPLYISTLLGFSISMVSFVYATYAIYANLFTDKVISGWTSTLVSIQFIGGITLLMLGILGDYLGRIFIESKKRPSYIVRETNIKPN